MELLDVLDEEGNITGKTEDKEVVEKQDSNYLFGKWEDIQEVIKYLEEKILERR